MNKPVAWMLNGILHECDPSDWAKEQYPDQDVIPLYTHPVKELNVPDGLIDPKSYYIGYEDGKKKSQADIEYEADKAYWRNRELTDEEIYEIWWQSDVASNYYRDSKEFGIEFAKAILRKAQSK